MAATVCGTVIFIFAVMGCAAFHITLDRHLWKDIVERPVGILVLVPEKRLVLSEGLYRVFWLERRETYYTFEGIWDPGPTLANACMSRLERQFNVRAVALSSSLPPGTYQEIVKRSEALFNAARRRGEASGSSYSAFASEWRWKQPEGYLKAVHPEWNDAFRHRLGFDFVLELSLAGISVEVGTFGEKGLLWAFIHGRLIRLADGRVVWLSRGRGPSFVEPIAALQENNLALLRENYERAVTGACQHLFDGLKPN